MVRDQEVGGSNPLAPTKFLSNISYLGMRYFGLEGSKRDFALYLPFSCIVVPQLKSCALPVVVSLA